MDTEEEINNAAEKIMRDITVSKLDALNMLLGRYQSQKRLEEAVIVQRIIEREQSKPEDILAPLTEGGVGEGIVEAVTEEAMVEEGEQIHWTTNARKTKKKPK